MTRQGEHPTSFLPKVSVSAKQITSKLSLRASLALALLLVSGSTMTLATFAETPLEIAQTATATDSRPTIYVNPATGTDKPEAGNSEAVAVRTITFALKNAKAGTVVKLAPGSYTADTGEVFPLVVPAGVTLIGDEANQGQRVAVIGGNSYSSRTEATQNITILASQDSVISGLTVTNPNIRGTAIWVESVKTTIKNNTFSNSKREGVLVAGTATPLIENNLFTKNSGNGISIGRTAKGEIKNNTFVDTGFGIALSESAAPLIAQNRLAENVDGIVASSSTAPVLRNNTIENNKRDGLVVISNAQPDLGTQESPGQNIIRNNARYDVNNATKNITLMAYGNDINAKKVAGKIDLVATNIASGDLKDIQGHWAQSYIQSLSSKGIIAGFNDGTFRPNEPVTRAQFAAIINKAFAPSAERDGKTFADVSSKHWATAPIQVAYRGGFMSGYPGNKFQPDQRIPKVQALVSLASGLKFRSDDPAVLSVYKDASTIPGYATQAVAGATVKEMVVNYPLANELNPNRDATRAEVAAFVHQALVNAGRASAIPSDYLVKNPITAQR